MSVDERGAGGNAPFDSDGDGCNLGRVGEASANTGRRRHHHRRHNRAPRFGQRYTWWQVALSIVVAVVGVTGLIFLLGCQTPSAWHG